MNLTKELIRQCFGPDVKISSRFPFGGYEVKTRTGGRVVVTSRKFEDIKGGADIWDGVVRLGGMLWGGVITTGSLADIAHAALSGQRCGVNVEAGESKRFFGLLKTPPARASASVRCPWQSGP